MSQTDVAMREPEGPVRGETDRDVKNHLLFEVCSEVGRQRKVSPVRESLRGEHLIKDS
jgi:hypothetical protein